MATGFIRLACLALGLLAAGAASAQSVMGTATMPPPPSSKDPLPKSNSETKRQKPSAAKPVRGTRADARGTSDQPGFSQRIDARPQGELRRDQLQLENSGSLSPVMQNGRPGVGMRF